VHTRRKWEAGLSGLPIATIRQSGPGRERVGRGPQLLGDPAGFVEDDEDVAGVDALEPVGVGVRGFPSVADEFVVDEPFGLVHAAGELPGAVVLANVPPQDRPDLGERGRGGDDEGFAGRVGVEPPAGDQRGRPRLADTVPGTDCDTAVVADRVEDLPLLRPHRLPEALLDPAHRVRPVLRSPAGEGVAVDEGLQLIAEDLQLPGVARADELADLLADPLDVRCCCRHRRWHG
jgi:hypothetical protein